MSHAAGAQEMTGNGFDMAIQQAANELHGANMTQFGWLMNEQPPTFVNASATPKHQPTQTPYQHMAHHGSIDFGNHFGDGSDMMGGNPYQNMLAQAAAMQTIDMGHGQMHPPPQTPSHISAPTTQPSEMMHTADALSGMPGSSQSLLNMIPSTTINAHEVRDLLTANTLQFAGLTPLETSHDGHIDAGPHTAPARLDETTDGRLYRFGSDSHFGLDGFKPASQHERHDMIAQRLTEELHMLKPINRSNVPTRASSPNHHQHQMATLHGGHAKRLTGAAIKQEDDEANHINRPKKRRKDDAVSDEEDGSPAAKRKFSVPNPKLRRVSSTANELSPKRRRSSVTASAANSKAARENLSEEQKRSNHIQSEQKRRNLIKNGFDELRRLVPELRAGGLSKSMELMEVSNFLEQVIKANELLRARLGIQKPG